MEKPLTASVSQQPPEQLDVIAVGAHPDDVEIGCGGTLARLAQQGYRVGIIDLTDGEPTPGSPGPEAAIDGSSRGGRQVGCSGTRDLGIAQPKIVRFVRGSGPIGD